MAARMSARTVGPEPGIGTVYVCRALTRWARRDGRTCSSLASARREVSSIPATLPAAAVRSPTATASGHPRDPMDGVTEVAEAIDVVADRPRGYPEPLRQVRPRP